MVIKGQDDTYDISGFGLGEGLMLCHEWELKQLMMEIREILRKEAKEDDATNGA